MRVLDYTMDPEVDCLDSDVNDAAFVRATTTIGGRDAAEEFLACGVYPLLADFDFMNVSIGVTAMSEVEMVLPVFPVETVSTEAANHFLATVEIDAECWGCRPEALCQRSPQNHRAYQAPHVLIHELAFAPQMFLAGWQEQHP
jgi:hypothetical protein